jgi:hypothetical protein
VWFAIVPRVDVQPRRDAGEEIGAHSEVFTHDRSSRKRIAEKVAPAPILTYTRCRSTTLRLGAGGVRKRSSQPGFFRHGSGVRQSAAFGHLVIHVASCRARRPDIVSLSDINVEFELSDAHHRWWRELLTTAHRRNERAAGAAWIVLRPMYPDYAVASHLSVRVCAESRFRSMRRLHGIRRGDVCDMRWAAVTGAGGRSKYCIGTQNK